MQPAGDAAAGTGCAAHTEDIGRAADDGMLRGKGRRISFFDEMTGQEGGTRSPYREYCGWFEAEDAARIQRKAQQAGGSEGGDRRGVYVGEVAAP